MSSDLVGQALHLLDAGARLVAHLLVVGQQLDLLQAQAQAGQGRAQLMGGVRGELALGGQAPGHALGGADELGLDQVDLLDAGAAKAGADLAAAQLLGLGLNYLPLSFRASAKNLFLLLLA